MHKEWASWIHAKIPLHFQMLSANTCICIDTGKDYDMPRALFPVRPDFLAHGGKLVGREELDIE